VPDSSFEVEISCTHVLGTCPCYVCVKEGRKKHSTAQLLVRRYTRRMFTHTHIEQWIVDTRHYEKHMHVSVLGKLIILPADSYISEPLKSLTNK
jgi:hypothetical protein